MNQSTGFGGCAGACDQLNQCQLVFVPAAWGQDGLCDSGATAVNIASKYGHRITADPFQNFGKQLFLGAEVTTDQGRVDFRIRCNAPQTGPVIPFVKEMVSSGFQDSFARGGGVAPSIVVGISH